MDVVLNLRYTVTRCMSPMCTLHCCHIQVEVVERMCAEVTTLSRAAPVPGKGPGGSPAPLPAYSSELLSPTRAFGHEYFLISHALEELREYSVKVIRDRGQDASGGTGTIGLAGNCHVLASVVVYVYMLLFSACLHSDGTWRRSIDTQHNASPLHSSADAYASLLRSL